MNEDTLRMSCEREEALVTSAHLGDSTFEILTPTGRI